MKSYYKSQAKMNLSAKAQGRNLKNANVLLRFPCISAPLRISIPAKG